MTTTQRALLALLVAASLQSPRPLQSAAAEWPQWGGPTRNFVSDAKGLATS
jgi:hypothetical protein